MAHKVKSLGEIYLDDGKEIDGRFWGNTTNDTIHNDCDWQDEVRTKIYYRAWKKFLKLICQDNSRVLIIPLGKWTK